jgi:hypothetical protein
LKFGEHRFVLLFCDESPASLLHGSVVLLESNKGRQEGVKWGWSWALVRLPHPVVFIHPSGKSESEISEDA